MNIDMNALEQHQTTLLFHFYDFGDRDEFIDMLGGRNTDTHYSIDVFYLRTDYGYSTDCFIKIEARGRENAEMLYEQISNWADDCGTDTMYSSIV